jgi:hypothetical protein
MAFLLRPKATHIHLKRVWARDKYPFVLHALHLNDESKGIMITTNGEFISGLLHIVSTQMYICRLVLPLTTELYI